MVNRSQRVLKHLLDTPRRARIKHEWQKANSRLKDDADGAVTMARTLIETVCKYILDGSGIDYRNDGDLTKLYGNVAEVLGLSVNSSTDDINKRLFGSVYNIVKALGELRNKAGDAHGRGGSEIHVSQSQAELAVTIAEAMTTFLLTMFDAHVEVAHRLNSDGSAILKFDIATVWRLVDHARNSPEHIKSMDDAGAPEPALWLVGDAGLYLMSNGTPPIYQNGRIMAENEDAYGLRLCAYAQYCGPNDDIDDWWPIHTAVERGHDFSRTLPINFLLTALEESERFVVIAASPGRTQIYSDIEWNAGDARTQ